MRVSSEGLVSKFIVIEGLIGVGKTSLCRILRDEWGAELVLEFDHVHGRLEAIGSTIGEFQVAAEGGEYVAAEARISDDGQRIVLRAAGVAAPVDARYLWSDAGYASVRGGSGLPVAPFRTR